MAPKTRSNRFHTPPYQSADGLPADTIKKTRFFQAYDDRKPGETKRSICQAIGTTSPTARRWLQEREQLGSKAYRRTRKLSNRLGRKVSVPNETIKQLVSPSKNPVRHQPYEVQLEHHKIPLKKRQLQKRLKDITNGGQMYKQAYVAKVISAVNKGKRIKYGEEHRYESVDTFWQYIFFTDEAHFDPTAQKQGTILRERGTRYDAENIQERKELKGVRVHAAGWVNWWGKCDKLEFYHDEEDRLERPPRPPKPRSRKYESKEEFEARIKEWEALLPHEVEIKPKGNSMTQKYYTERLLPVYIKAIQKARLQHAEPWVLQEDNDGSHGTRKRGLAAELKDANWIVTFVHPPQSPDLNPIEGCWLILKERVLKREWKDLEEYKQVIQDEWSKITMQEVRARIAEMPGRCKRLVDTGGNPIRSDLW